MLRVLIANESGLFRDALKLTIERVPDRLRLPWFEGVGVQEEAALDSSTLPCGSRASERPASASGCP
jgi:hypothetical protein